jgi:DNA-binding NarL/FixJ family response regulator
MSRPPDEINTHDRVATLSKREQQVAALLCKGLSNKSIAQKLNVGEGTIKGHLHRIYSKLGVQSRYALIVALGRTNSE